MKSIFSYWHVDMGMMIFIIALAFLYLFMIDFKYHKKSAYFFTGFLFLIIAVASPLHFLGMHYLFSAHMIAHITLLLIAAPLMVAGIPPENRFKKGLVFLSKQMHSAPLVCWLAGVGIMWFWHIPYFFNQMFAAHDMMHVNNLTSAIAIVHASSLLLSGMIFSWPFVSAYPQYRIAPMQGVLYLSIACVFCSLLGLLLTFAPVGTYNYNIHAYDSYGFLSVIRSRWNISAGMDQQIAGMIMWVPCCFIYLLAIMFLLKKWFYEKEVTTAHLATTNNLLSNDRK